MSNPGVSLDPESPPRPTWERARLTPFFVLWGGQAGSLLGSQAVQFALIWWLTMQTGSATVLAIASLVGLLPTVVLGPVIGVLVDRWNRKAIMLAADGAVAMVSAGLALLFATGVARFEHVLVALLVRAIGGAFHGPAMLASTTLMVPRDHLTRIQGFNQGLQGALLVVSAPLGAALLGWFSLAGILLVDVATAMVALVPLVFIRVPQPARDGGTADDGSEDGLWPGIVAGLRYLKDRPGHLALVGLGSVINLFLVPAFTLLPLLIADQLRGSALQLGWTSSAFGVGMLVGGIALGIWGGFKRRILTSLVALLGLGLAVFALGLTPASFIPAAMISMLFVGLMVPWVNGPIQAVLQATVAPEFQGRVFTLISSLAGLTAPVGLILAAPLADLVGVRAWYLAGALACVLMSTAGFFVPAILRIEDGSSAEVQDATFAS
jgi:DHA3 family macrolide efflux protein-like MFS transporter